MNRMGEIEWFFDGMWYVATYLRKEGRVGRVEKTSRYSETLHGFFDRHVQPVNKSTISISVTYVAKFATDYGVFREKPVYAS